MELNPFELERYFAKYEFSTKYLLSSSDCDGLPQSEVVSWADPETQKLWDNLTLGYTESTGLPLLREEVAKMYEGISPDEVLILTPEEGIFIALNSLLNPGDHVICTWPGYQSHYEIAESLGCEVQKWEPSEEENWKFDVDWLEQQIKKGTKLIIANFPHNPTGYLPPKDDYRRLIEIARENDIYVLSDEMYRFLESDPANRLPSACEIYDKAITLFGMSKTFGMAGVRLGWVITKDENLRNHMSSFRDYTTICSSAPSEILSLIALRAREIIVSRHLERIQRNLNLLDEFFGRQSELFSWTRPKAGTIGFPRLLLAESSDEFCEKVVKEAGVLLLPSTVYGYDDKHFRLGFGRENLPDALAAFEDYLTLSLPA